MTTLRAGLAAIGECMLEFRHIDDAYSLGYGGDVFNAAVYAVRSGAQVSFISATGDEHYSAYLRENWQREGVQPEVKILTNRSPGLYVIETDNRGERSFHYWRDNTPFKQLLDEGDYLNALPDLLARHQIVYYSGISLALFAPAKRETLFSLLSEFRGSGGRVAFDPNFRPKLWLNDTSPEEWIDRAYGLCDIALPSLDDENLLRGLSNSEQLIEHIRGLGPKEIAVKDGANGAIVVDAEAMHHIAANQPDEIVDTTAAGDSFNGTYLAKRLSGQAPIAAATAGGRMAATVIQHAGAIIPAEISLGS